MRQAYDYWQNQPDNFTDGRSPGSAGGTGATRGAHAPEGAEFRYTEGAHGAPDRRDHPRRTGRARAAIQLPPLSSSAPVRTQRFRPPPGRAGTGCGIRPSEGGPDPRATAGERRLAQGGFPRDTTKGRVCWPAAKSPQASALPGIQGSQGFSGRGAPRGGRYAA